MLFCFLRAERRMGPRRRDSRSQTKALSAKPVRCGACIGRGS
jgi:hypothetical protein